MGYKSITRLKKDLENVGLLEAALDPAVRVRGAVRDGILHTRRPGPGGPNLGPQIDALVPLHLLLAGDVVRCDGTYHGHPGPNCPEQCGWDPVTFDLDSTVLEALAEAGGKVAEVERHAAGIPDLKNRAQAAEVHLASLSEATWYLNQVTPEQVEQVGFTAERDAILRRHAAATQTWRDVESSADTHQQTLQRIRAKLGGAHHEHFPLDDHAIREVLIGFPDPLKFDTLVKNLAATAVVPANDELKKAVVRAPAYVRDYALTFEDTSYADAQLVDDPAAAADASLLEMAVGLWDPDGDGPLVNLANAVTAVQNARA